MCFCLLAAGMSENEQQMRTIPHAGNLWRKNTELSSKMGTPENISQPPRDEATIVSHTVSLNRGELQW